MPEFGIGQNAGLDPRHVAWCRDLWNAMNEGGVWIVPRSNSILHKQGHRMTFEGDDDHEFEGMRRHFAAIGVEVVRVESERTKGAA